VRTLTDTVKFAPLFPGEGPQERSCQLPLGQELIYQLHGPNPSEDNSALEVHLQVGHTDPSHEEDVLLDLTNHLAYTSAYQRLRTEEQLGYIVFTSLRRLNGAQGLSIVVQSSMEGPARLDKRIEEWMASFRGELEKMSEEEFGNHVQAVVALKLEKDKRLSEESFRHWGEIVER
jgi:insulysin